jgi:hypothetical protein
MDRCADRQPGLLALALEPVAEGVGMKRLALTPHQKSQVF